MSSYELELIKIIYNTNSMFYRFVFVIGILMLILNFIGFPNEWKEVAFSLVAIILIFGAIVGMVRSGANEED